MERWGKTFKEPDEPPPRHSALDWDNFGPSSPQQQRRSKPAGQAGSDDAAYLQLHAVSDALQRAIAAVVADRPDDPIVAIGKFLTDEAARKADDESGAFSVAELRRQLSGEEPETEVS